MKEKTTYRVEGFLKIRDKETQEILLDKCNAIHYGNLATSVAESLSGLSRGHIRYMAFGNGGTSVSTNGVVSYKGTNTNTVKDSSDALYNETFFKEIDGTTGNTSVPINSSTTYSDIKVTATLDFIDTGTSQAIADRASAKTDVTFDELGIYCGIPGISNATLLSENPEALLVTHVIFHPILKSENRILEVDYTIRIHLQEA